MRAAFAATRERAEGILSITAVQTFAANWLVPRLGSFQLAHPHLAVRLDTSMRLADFAREEFDVGIRAGDGEWPGLVAHRLLVVEFTPMLSPRLAASIGGVTKPADLLRLPLLDPSDPWWVVWFARAGVPDPGLGSRPANRFGTQVLEAGAAVAGQGVAILTPAFFRAELDSGRLIQPFDLVGRDEGAYWLVYPSARRNVPKIRAFREWLMAEVAACSPGGA